MNSINQKQILWINVCFIAFLGLLGWISDSHLSAPPPTPEGDKIALAKYTLVCARASVYLHVGFLFLIITVNAILVLLPRYLNKQKCPVDIGPK